MEVTLETLGINLAKTRSTREIGIRQAAKEISISPTTLSRIENGNIPDIQTFKKICGWIGADPGSVLNSNSVNNTQIPQVAVHFRKSQTMTPEVAAALADMLILAQGAMETSTFDDSPEEE